MKKYTIPCFFVFFLCGQIDVIMNFAVITNAVIKRVHCIINCEVKNHRLKLNINLACFFFV